MLLPGPMLLAACGQKVEPVPVGAGCFEAASSGDVVLVLAAPKAAPAPKAKAAANKDKAKGDYRLAVGNVIKQSVNMLHACTRVMAQPDVLLQSRWIIHCVRPILEEHSSCARNLRSPEQTLTYYIDEAQGKWMAVLNKMLLSLSDKIGLERCGLTVECTADTCRGLKVDSAKVACEDAVAASIFKICINVIAERCHSCSVYVLCWPYKLAPLASPDEGVQADHMLLLKKRSGRHTEQRRRQDCLLWCHSWKATP